MSNNDIQTEFDSAVAVARQALAEFRKQPLVASKRGGPRLSPWWRVYVQASEVAVRWFRQVRREDRELSSFSDELDRLLRGDAE
jgi:hypothetical protein